MTTTYHNAVFTGDDWTLYGDIPGHCVLALRLYRELSQDTCHRRVKRVLKMLDIIGVYSNYYHGPKMILGDALRSAIFVDVIIKSCDQVPDTYDCCSLPTEPSRV